jgi:hypothetical protein
LEGGGVDFGGSVEGKVNCELRTETERSLQARMWAGGWKASKGVAKPKLGWLETTHFSRRDGRN